MKRTILSLLVAGLFAGIGTSALAQDAAAQPAPTEQTGASPGTDSDSQQPAKSAAKPAKADSSAIAPLDTDALTAQRPAASAKQTNPDKADVTAQKPSMSGTDDVKEMESAPAKKTKDY